jgi:hypothetical protein
VAERISFFLFLASLIRHTALSISRSLPLSHALSCGGLNPVRSPDAGRLHAA